MSEMPHGISHETKCRHLGNSVEPFGLKFGSHNVFQKTTYFLKEKQEADNILNPQELPLKMLCTKAFSVNPALLQ